MLAPGVQSLARRFVSPSSEPARTDSTPLRRRASAPPVTECLSKPALVCLIAQAAALAGCEDVFRPQAFQAPSEERFKAAYSDLSSGRYTIIADFEQADRPEFFRTEPSAGRAWCALSSALARKQTGSAALRVHLNGPADQLVASNTDQAAKPTFPRDWTKYSLLLSNIHSPRLVPVVTFEVRGGSDRAGPFRRDEITLRQGWNLLRLDLGEVGDQVDLRNVRQLRWRCPQLAQPVDLYFDDLILVDNRRDLLASPKGPPGSLYAQSVGRRLRVGAAGRFELVFARGQIIKWFGLQADPHKLFDLVGPEMLGPFPVVLPNVAGESITLHWTQWSPLGRHVTMRQAVKEANPLRVIVVGEWKFADAAAAGVRESARRDDALTGGPPVPTVRWAYTVYADGRVFVRLDCPTQHGQWQAPEVGFAVCCDGRAGFDRLCRPGMATQPTRSCPDAAYVLYCRRRAHQADALFVPHQRVQAPNVESLLAQDNPSLCSLFRGGPTDRAIQRWAMMITVWPPDLDSAETAKLLAMDYCNPAEVRVAVGKLVRTDDGDLNNDGFNESEGCYVLSPDGDRLRATFGPGNLLRFSPVFKVLGTAEKQAWIYSDGRIVAPAWRDADGQLTFRLRGIIDGQRLIEVHFQPGPGAEAASSSDATDTPDARAAGRGRSRKRLENRMPRHRVSGLAGIGLTPMGLSSILARLSA